MRYILDMESALIHPLRTWRLSQDPNVSVARAADAVGATRQTWYEWEKWGVPNRSMMPKVCELTGLEPNDFYKREAEVARKAA